LVGNLFKTAGRGIFGFGNKIHGAEREGFQRGVTALLRMRAEKNDGQRRAPHDQAQGLHAVHARHLEVECDDVGMKFFNFFQRECAVHCGADHFN